MNQCPKCHAIHENGDYAEPHKIFNMTYAEVENLPKEDCHECKQPTWWEKFWSGLLNACPFGMKGA